MDYETRSDDVNLDRLLSEELAHFSEGSETDMSYTNLPTDNGWSESDEETFDVESFLTSLIEPRLPQNDGSDAIQEEDNPDEEATSFTNRTDDELETEDEEDEIDRLLKEILGEDEEEETVASRPKRSEPNQTKMQVHAQSSDPIEERLQKVEQLAEAFMKAIELQKWLENATDTALRFQDQMANYGLKLKDEDLKQAIEEAYPLMMSGVPDALERSLAKHVMSQMAQMMKANSKPFRERSVSLSQPEPKSVKDKSIIDYLLEELGR